MFDFIKTTVINSTVDELSGLPLFAHIQNTKQDAFSIKRFGVFEKECIKSLGHKAPIDAEPATFTFKLKGPYKEGLYQLNLHTDYHGSYPYSVGQGNSDYKYGTLHSYEFTVTEDNEDLSKIMPRLKKIIEKYQQMGTSEEGFTIEVQGNDTIVFTAKNPYMSFDYAHLVKYTEHEGTLSTYDIVEDLIVRDPSTGDFVESEGGSIAKENNLGFGTYLELITSVQIPTSENSDCMFGINSEMRPIRGAKYHQYIIEYYKNRGILGMDAVGQVTESHTQHVIWVLDGEVNDKFNEVLSEVMSPEERVAKPKPEEPKESKEEKTPKRSGK